MDNNMIRKRALWLFVTGSTKLLAIASLVALSGVSVGAGYAIGKATAPRKTDMLNLLTLYRLARLSNDLTNQLNLLNRLMQAKADNKRKKKTVYGLV